MLLSSRGIKSLGGPAGVASRAPLRPLPAWLGGPRSTPATLIQTKQPEYPAATLHFCPFPWESWNGSARPSSVNIYLIDWTQARPLLSRGADPVLRITAAEVGRRWGR